MPNAVSGKTIDFKSFRVTSHTVSNLSKNDGGDCSRSCAHLSPLFAFFFHRVRSIVTRGAELYVPQAPVSQGAARETLPCRSLLWTYVLMVSISPLPLRLRRQSELESGTMARRSRLYEIIAFYLDIPQTGIRRLLCPRKTMMYNVMID